MFNTQKVLDVMSFNLPVEISLQEKTISPGPITLIRNGDIYNFYRYEEQENRMFSPVFQGYLPVSQGSLFFQKIFKVDLIEEADINL